LRTFSGKYQQVFLSFWAKTCKKSQKGVYLQHQKSQKGVEYSGTKISKRCKQNYDEAENISATP
jgi:hypothetical protein